MEVTDLKENFWNFFANQTNCVILINEWMYDRECKFAGGFIYFSEIPNRSRDIDDFVSLRKKIISIKVLASQEQEQLAI